MHLDMTLIDAQQGAVIAAAAAIFLFVIQWTASSRWWRDDLATTFVLKDLLMLLVMVPLVLTVWFPHINFQFLEWCYLISMCGITVVVLWRMVVMYHVLPPRHDPVRAVIAAIRSTAGAVSDGVRRIFHRDAAL